MPFVWSTWLYIHTIQSQQKNPVTFLSPYKPPFLWWCQLNIPINCYNRPPESVMQKIKAPKPSPRNTSTPQKAHRSCPPSSLDVESTRHRQSIQWYARWGKCWGELLNKHHLLHKFWRSSCFSTISHNILVADVAVCWCFRWREPRSSRLLSQNHYADVVSLRQSGLDNCHRPSNVASNLPKKTKKHCGWQVGWFFNQGGMVEYHRYSGEMIFKKIPMIHEGYLPYQLRVSDSYPLGPIWQSQQDVYRIISQQKAHLKMDKTRHTICNQWPTVINPNRFNVCKELEQHDTHKDHRENEVRTCWRLRLPKKDLYLAGCLFFLQKKRVGASSSGFSHWHVLPTIKKWTSPALTPFLGEFWWLSWKVIGVIMMWILGKPSEFDDLSPSSKFLMYFMFQNKITSGCIPGVHTRQSAWFLSCSIVEEVGSATLNSQCLFRPRNSNLHWPYALRRAPGTPSKCL